MKTTEQQYVESYDKQGCLALVFGALVLMLLVSLAVNVILYMKIKIDEKAAIKTSSMEYCPACNSAKANAKTGTNGILSYCTLEKGKQAFQDGKSFMLQAQGKRFYCPIRGNRSQSSTRNM